MTEPYLTACPYFFKLYRACRDHDRAFDAAERVAIRVTEGVDPKVAMKDELKKLNHG